MNLNITLYEENVSVYEASITMNCRRMAQEACLWYPIWHPEDTHKEKAWQIINELEHGIGMLTARPTHYEVISDNNTWGTYSEFLVFCVKYREACQRFPNAEITISR